MDILQITYSEWANLGILLLIISLIVRKKIPVCLSLAAMVTGFILWGISFYGNPAIYSAIWIQLSIFFGGFLLLLKTFPQSWLELKFIGRWKRFHPRKDQIFLLPLPIVRGKTKVEIEGKVWTIIGPDLPIGSQVQIKSIEGDTFFVQPYKIL